MCSKPTLKLKRIPDQNLTHEAPCLTVCNKPRLNWILWAKVIQLRFYWLPEVVVMLIRNRSALMDQCGEEDTESNGRIAGRELQPQEEGYECPMAPQAAPTLFCTPHAYQYIHPKCLFPRCFIEAHGGTNSSLRRTPPSKREYNALESERQQRTGTHKDKILKDATGDIYDFPDRAMWQSKAITFSDFQP